MGQYFRRWFRPPVVLLIAMLGLSTDLLAGGSYVTIVSRNGERIEGELMLVLDSILVVEREDQDASPDSVRFARIPFSGVLVLAIGGNSSASLGMVLGLLIGGAAGGFDTHGSEEWSKDGALSGALILGSFGGLTGLLFSSSSVLLEAPSRGNFYSLRDHASFGDNEQDFLESKHVMPERGK